MKYFIILYIALGFVLSLITGIDYNCDGTEIFPEYYGNPFVFKERSLGSSLTYFYSISGLILNVIIWSSIIFLLEKIIQNLIKKTNKNKYVMSFYKIFIVILILFSSFIISMDYIMMGRGFDKNHNYWYFNIDEEAEKWGLNCEGKLR